MRRKRSVGTGAHKDVGTGVIQFEVDSAHHRTKTGGPERPPVLGFDLIVRLLSLGYRTECPPGQLPCGRHHLECFQDLNVPTQEHFGCVGNTEAAIKDLVLDPKRQEISVLGHVLIIDLKGPLSDVCLETLNNLIGNLEGQRRWEDYWLDSPEQT